MYKICKTHYLNKSHTHPLLKWVSHFICSHLFLKLNREDAFPISQTRREDAFPSSQTRREDAFPRNNLIYREISEKWKEMAFFLPSPIAAAITS